MVEIKRKLEITLTTAKVYENLTAQASLSGWWVPDTIADSRLGNVLRFGFGPTYFKEMKVTDWAMFLRSLKLLCEKGKGLPFPDQHQ